ncbi:MAG: hypothetical protein RIR11_4409 [Bacteroidota bacterium]|jgi:uncharacterized protein (TIGR02646 family)
MKSFIRGIEPLALQQESAGWNRQWAALRQGNASSRFNWSRYNGTPVNQIILPDLKAQTQNHCSYCDFFPSLDGSIDHFCPKSKPEFYHLAYTWSNLYIACNKCQRAKMEKFSPLLLRPDDVFYTFERYFIYNYTTHTVDINPVASVEERQSAKETISMFNFNDIGQITQRRHSYERWIGQPAQDRDLDDFAYRFILI